MKIKRFHKPPKKTYRFVITTTAGTVKKKFNAFSDNAAKTKLYAKLHQLPPGGIIVLDYRDKEKREWVVLERGGKDVSDER